MWVVSDNDLGVEGAKALGPHVAKLLQLQTLNLESACLQLTFDVLRVMWVLVRVCGVWHIYAGVNEAWICVGRLIGVVGWLSSGTV